MATLVGSKAASGVQPRGIHAGVNCQKSLYTTTATLSAGDVIQMVKIPDDAIVDYVAVASNVALGVKLGDGVSVERYLASADLVAATITTGNLGLGYKYEISDAASVFYDTIDVTIGTVAGSIGVTVELVVMYHNDE